jgi:hypothetical protein
MYYTLLLPLRFISFRMIAIQLNRAHSEMAIEFGRWDRLWISQRGNSSTESGNSRMKASEQIKSPQNTQRICLKSRPRVHSEPPFRPQRKVSDNTRTNDRLFCESLRRFIHSHIITATIERPNLTSPGALSLVDALRLTNCPRPPPHSTVLVRCEAASMDSREQRLAGRGGSVRCASAIGAHPDGAAGCGPAVPCGIDREQTRRCRLRPITSGH